MIAIQQSGAVVVVLCRPPWRVPLGEPCDARVYAAVLRDDAAYRRTGLGRLGEIAPADRHRLAEEIELAAELADAAWGERVNLAPGPAAGAG